MTQDPFNPTSSYTSPKSESSAYLKFGSGSTEFLALSSPVVGWQYWNTEKKPVRLITEPTGDYALLPKIRVEDNGKYNVQHFWAFPAIDCSDGKVKILEITQKTVQRDIRAYIKNERWGSPVLKYTFTVMKTGTDKDTTKYTVMANPLASGVPANWLQAWKDVVDFGFNLNELFVGGDPFKPTASVVPAEVTSATVATSTEPTTAVVTDDATPPN